MIARWLNINVNCIDIKEDLKMVKKMVKGN